MAYVKRNATRGDKLRAELEKRNQTTRYLDSEIVKLAEKFSLAFLTARRIVTEWEKQKCNAE